MLFYKYAQYNYVKTGLKKKTGEIESFCCRAINNKAFLISAWSVVNIAELYYPFSPGIYAPQCFASQHVLKEHRQDNFAVKTSCYNFVNL